MYYVENYPEIKNNYYLGARNVGASRRLRGDIGIIVCFMRRKPTDFPESTRAQFFSELNKACDWLKGKAKGFGTALDFCSYYFDIDIPENANPHQGYELIRKFFSAENQNIDYLQSYYEKRLNIDEAPFILVFDQNDRSFAQKQSTPTGYTNEYSVVFKDYGSFSWSTIAHELLHQFGALDYYYPKEVTEHAKFYFKDSIMGIGRNDVLDDLTAYIVGMKDTISASTYGFLKSTMWMTGALREKAIAATWKGDDGPIIKNDTSSRTQTRATQLNFTSLRAKFFGKVLAIPVSVGQTVKATDIVLLLTGTYGVVPIQASVPGRVDKIHVKCGDVVKDGTLLAVIAKL